LIGIQQALIQRSHSGLGSRVKVSLFGSAAELMSVPYLQTRYGGKAPERVGLKHPTIAPYGAFTCADGREVVISIQNEREWADFCRWVLLRPELLEDTRCKSNSDRVQNREFVDGLVASVFATLGSGDIADRLTAAQTAFGQVNSVYDLIQHPQLRTRYMQVQGKKIEIPSIPWGMEWDSDTFPAAPDLDQHGQLLRQEFGEDEASSTIRKTA
jgi:crotonobetainyl-CoA:carnitine CoA-transferase CaiB-like acyl-CoA transferase